MIPCGSPVAAASIHPRRLARRAGGQRIRHVRWVVIVSMLVGIILVPGASPSDTDATSTNIVAATESTRRRVDTTGVVVRGTSPPIRPVLTPRIVLLRDGAAAVAQVHLEGAQGAAGVTVVVIVIVIAITRLGICLGQQLGPRVPNDNLLHGGRYFDRDAVALRRRSRCGGGGGDDASAMMEPPRIPDRPSLGLQRAESMSGNVLVVLEGSSTGVKQADEARRGYWIQRKVGKLTHGSVRIGYVLRRREEEEEDLGGELDDLLDVQARAQWEMTPQKNAVASQDKKQGGGGASSDAAYEMVAIKMYDRSKVSSTSDSNGGPTVEIAASQLLAQHTPGFYHVLETVEVLADNRFIYLIMPYCNGGDMLSFVESQGRLEENVARHVFKQLLSALDLFQSAGLCHRDLSLEHIMMRGGDCFLSGKGKCLRIPYNSALTQEGGEGIADVEAGSTRRLISPQGQCGQPEYMGPVMLANREGFDAHATDLWSAAIVLFHMLFGAPPFALANNDDPRFLAISTKGQLADCAKAWCKDLGSSRNGQISPPSDNAIDLLQAMLMADPKDRLSLHQILTHPWVTSDDVKRLDSVNSVSVLTDIRRASMGM
mmetsp:Transcript_15732/g.45348  ORF Transcript_15732/g.45348 Transcript_15732/m.45348 type:complete len:600 (-) Transcript_15732:759-2558(-)